jgi:CheY-like chemotaxis protein/anti-sigma regulatory factor (Ser/Thr protein kinase)
MAADFSAPTEQRRERPTRLLVVEDNAVDRLAVDDLIGTALGWQVEHAHDGARGLACLSRCSPDIVLTDLILPEIDGLELVRAVRKLHPLVPVVLMTAYGNEEVALKALQQGAAGYVPKRLLRRDLVETLRRVLTAAGAVRERQRLLSCVCHAETSFTLENDPALLGALVTLLQESLAGLGLVDGTDQIRVGVALEEALLNAMYHGNLEVSSELRQQGDEPFNRLAHERRGQMPYRDRRVHVTARVSPAEAVYVIRDEGPGFDPAALPDPTDPANLERASGRGLLLIRTFMDDVRHNAPGNQITLVKRRKGEPLRQAVPC